MLIFFMAPYKYNNIKYFLIFFLSLEILNALKMFECAMDFYF